MSQRRVPKPVPQRIALVTGKRSVSIPHVVIVGGGFGGLYTAKRLKYRPVRITLIDRRNHHLFQPLPGVATVAIQQGCATADNLWRVCRGQLLVPFRYKERGSMATIGRARAVADLGRLQFTGFVAWVLWLVVHLYFLIGFEDRLLVMIQWAWAYLTLQRGARLITHEQRRERRAL